MDGRVELKDKTLLPCLNHLHKDHQTLQITNGLFQFLPSLPFCSIWVLLHACFCQVPFLCWPLQCQSP